MQQCSVQAGIVIIIFVGFSSNKARTKSQMKVTIEVVLNCTLMFQLLIISGRIA
jgi:hypothetical protein